MAYRHWLPEQGPDWLKDDGGRALAGEMGGILDDQRDRLRQAVLARFPTKGAVDPTTGSYTTAPGDALDNIAADRKLRRALNESPSDSGGSKDQALAARTQDAWDQWEYGGAHYGVLRALALAGYTGAVVVQQNGRRATLTGTSGTVADLVLASLNTCVTRSNHPGWTFDTRETFWSIFALVFPTDATNLQTTAGQAMLNAIVRDWMDVRVFAGTFVILAGQILGWPPTRALGTGRNLGGNSVRIIPPDGSPAYVVGP